MCCAVNGSNINATSITMEQRTLFDEQIRFVKSDQIKRSEILTSNGFHTYIRKKRYICMAQISIIGRKHTINRTTSIEQHYIEGIIRLIWNVCLRLYSDWQKKCVYVLISTEDVLSKNSLLTLLH